MTLYEAEKGATCLIKGLYVEPAVTRRLQALGLNDGTTVNVLNRKKHGALIIQVRGTRLALGKHISSNIEIKLESSVAKRGNAGTKEDLGTRQEIAGTKKGDLEAEQGSLEAKQENAGTKKGDLEAKQRNAESSRQEVCK